MSEKAKKFYITTPIYYCNRPPHAGSAYTTLAADILARYHRQKGDDVFFLTGLDEHGAKMAEAAEEAGKEPQAFCDEMAVKFQKAWEALNISNDGFIRTTDKAHKKAVQNALQVLYDDGFIYKGEYEGFYCVGCEQYLTKTDLVDGKCPDHNREPEVLKEETYFLKLSQFQDELLQKIKDDEFIIEPKERKAEMVSFLEKQDLHDVSISRKKVSWGIKLPFDESHTSYVWVDAFLNYLTGLSWKGDPEDLPEKWTPDVQFMAKDILRVHATIWPGLLLALKIPLPKKLFVHGFFTVNGKKMSKSLGNVIDPVELAEKYGVDAVRYFLFREISFGKDGDVSETRLRERYNSDLASGLGNLVSRVLTMADKAGIKKPEDPRTAMRLSVNEAKDGYEKAIDVLKFNDALYSVWQLIGICDKYIETERPWEGKENSKQVISDLLFALSEIAKFLQPFMPDTSDKIAQQLKKGKAESLFPRL